MKVLVLYGSKDFAKYYNADVCPLYRELGGVEKKLFKLYEHFHFCNVGRCLASWKDNIEKYDMILIFDGIRGRDVLEYIRSKNQRAKIKIYYVNSMDESDRKCPTNYQGLGCEFYTFDYDDAIKYGMKFKHFYYEGADIGHQNIKIDNDVFFVGVDKNRLKLLKELQGCFDRLGISYKMVIVATPHKRYSNDDRRLLSNPVSYNDVIRNVMACRVVLDIVKEGQSGITLRPMEAMMLDKKLITNNLNVKKYKFYNPKNVFVLQERNIEELPEYISAPVIPVDDSIKKDYTFQE